MSEMQCASVRRDLQSAMCAMSKKQCAHFSRKTYPCQNIPALFLRACYATFQSVVGFRQISKHYITVQRTTCITDTVFTNVLQVKYSYFVAVDKYVAGYSDSISTTCAFEHTLYSVTRHWLINGIKIFDTMNLR
jgi:hypothetical protein